MMFRRWCYISCAGSALLAAWCCYAVTVHVQSPQHGADGLLCPAYFMLDFFVQSLVFVLVSHVCVSRCNHTDQPKVQLIILRVLAKIAHSTRKDCMVRFQIV